MSEIIIHETEFDIIEGTTMEEMCNKNGKDSV